MLETVKVQKTISADKQTIWAELWKADFAKDFLPEVKSTRGLALPTYSVPTKLLSWNTIDSTSIVMANTDLKANIASIELELQPMGNKTVVRFIVNLDNNFSMASIKRYRAIQALFKIKLAVLKDELEHNQVHWSPAFS
jgi:hypothetical protein